EPVTRLVTQGMVLKGGSAMSKSKGNVVDPDDMVGKYGADVTRLFILFAAPPEKDLEWSDTGVDGLDRFARRAHRLVEHHGPALSAASRAFASGSAQAMTGLSDPFVELRRRTHDTIARVTEGIDRRLHLNTAISSLMELTNAIYLAAPPPEGAVAAKEIQPADLPALREAIEALVLLLAPFAPHLAEECWSLLGETSLVALEAWPAADAELRRASEVEVAVQVNGKLRGRVSVAASAGETEVVRAAKADPKLASHLAGSVVRTVYVPGKLLNVVVRADQGA
ncbi:MAG: class I tRNA ligase family protein, partial [Acidobacteria bacterium]|nr:class I tRNA ligase family protein [Acidobacteriota bacterium]